MDKEKWIQKILTSANNKQLVELPEGFEERLMQRIANRKLPAPVITIKWMAAAACAAAVLFFINVSVLNEWKSYGAESSSSISAETANAGTSTENLNTNYNFFN
mgnify:CR=1 FL=1